MITHSGRCFCGDVRVDATGSPKWVAFCHCESCRRQTGAPVSAYASFPSENVDWSGEPPGVFESSPSVRRGFCRRCGSPLFYEGARWPGETHLHLGVLDDAHALAPTGQGFKKERLPWLHVDVRIPA